MLTIYELPFENLYLISYNVWSKRFSKEIVIIRILVSILIVNLRYLFYDNCAELYTIIYELLFLMLKVRINTAPLKFKFHGKYNVKR